MRITLLVTLLFVSVQLSFSQTTMPNGLDGGVKQSKTSNKEKINDNSPEFDNYVGFSLGHLARNMAVVNYQRNFTNRFSAKASVGLVFGQDQIHLFMDELKPVSPFESQLTLKKVFESSQPKLGLNYYLDFTGKVYTNPLEGTSLYNRNYFDFRFFAGVSIRNYKELYQINSLLQNSVTTVLLPIQNMGATLNLGLDTENENGITTEYYIGIGKLNSRFQKYTLDPNSNYYYNPTNQKKSESSLLLLIGVTVGLSF